MPRTHQPDPEENPAGRGGRLGEAGVRVCVATGWGCLFTGRHRGSGAGCGRAAAEDLSPGFWRHLAGPRGVDHLRARPGLHWWRAGSPGAQTGGGSLRDSVRDADARSRGRARSRGGGLQARGPGGPARLPRSQLRGEGPFLLTPSGSLSPGLPRLPPPRRSTWACRSQFQFRADRSTRGSGRVRSAAAAPRPREA